MKIWVDADACPVKDEIYRVALRHDIEVALVANSWMRVPMRSSVRLEVVQGDMDAADDWIAEHCEAGDVVVTADIPLASRCIKMRARVVTPTGRRLTEDNVGDALATRDLLTDLRSAGERTGGPPPLDQRDRSRFLQQLDEVIVRLERELAADRALPGR